VQSGGVDGWSAGAFVEAREGSEAPRPATAADLERMQGPARRSCVPHSSAPGTSTIGSPAASSSASAASTRWRY